MNAKSITAALGGAITLFILGYLAWGLLFADFFVEHSAAPAGFMKGPEDLNFIAIFLGNLCGATMLTIIFGSWGDIKTFAGGAKAGAIFGLLVGLGTDLIMYGTANALDLTSTIVDAVITAIVFGVTGGVVGMLLGRGGSSDSGGSE